MIRSAINRFLGREPEAQPEPVIELAPDPRGAPGTRVHHEILISEQLADGRFNWLCRVYAQNGACTERCERADTAEAAKNAALTFAAKTKLALRGGV